MINYVTSRQYLFSGQIFNILPRLASRDLIPSDFVVGDYVLVCVYMCACVKDNSKNSRFGNVI